MDSFKKGDNKQLHLLRQSFSPIPIHIAIILIDWSSTRFHWPCLDLLGKNTLFVSYK